MNPFDIYIYNIDSHICICVDAEKICGGLPTKLVRLFVSGKGLGWGKGCGWGEEIIVIV